MRTPALAIGWSLWARHRGANIAVLAAIPVCALLYAWFRTMIPLRISATHSFAHELPLSLLPMILSFVWVLYVCAQTEADPWKGFTGLPARLFSLPVRTRFLVLCHMAYGVGAILLLHLAWSGLVFAPLGVHFAMRWALLISATAMVSFQSAVWGLASFPWMRAAVIVVGGLLAGPLLAFTSVPGFDWSGREPFYSLITLAALPVVGGAALVTVAAERCGGWQPWAPVRRFARRLFDAVFLRQRPFATPAQAAAWLEWRRKGWIVTVAVAVCAAGSVFMLPVMALMGSAAELPSWYPFLHGLFWPLFLGASLGGSLARTDMNGAMMSAFHAIKPISTAEIVCVKTITGAMAIVAAWVAAVPLSFLAMLWPGWRELCQNTEFQTTLQWLRSDSSGLWWLGGMLLLTMLMTWHGMVANMAVSLTRRATLIPWTAIGWLTSLPILSGTALWFYRRPEVLMRVEPWLNAGLALFLLWKLSSFVRAFAEVRRRALWTPAQFRLGLALWILVAAGFIGGVLLCRWKLPVPTPLLLLATAGLWPAGELARAVINLDDNRHR